MHGLFERGRSKSQEFRNDGLRRTRKGLKAVSEYRKVFTKRFERKHIEVISSVVHLTLTAKSQASAYIFVHSYQTNLAGRVTVVFSCTNAG